MVRGGKGERQDAAAREAGSKNTHVSAWFDTKSGIALVNKTSLGARGARRFACVMQRERCYTAAVAASNTHTYTRESLYFYF